MVERYKSRVSEGMQVRSCDGEKIGKVVGCQPTGFVVEKGFLFPKDLLIPYERITNLGNGEISISMARADLAEPSATRTAAATARAGASSLTEEAKAAAIRVKEAITGTAGEARATNGNGETTLRGALDEFGKTAEVCCLLYTSRCV